MSKHLRLLSILPNIRMTHKSTDGLAYSSAPSIGLGLPIQVFDTPNKRTE